MSSRNIYHESFITLGIQLRVMFPPQLCCDLLNAKAYLEPGQASKMELFTKTVHWFQP